MTYFYQIIGFLFGIACIALVGMGVLYLLERL